MSLAGMTLSLLFWVAIILVAIWAVRTLASGGWQRETQAIEILKCRLAAGEISQTDFEQARQALDG